MNFKIAVLPGDGIGPEISAQVCSSEKVCERFGHTVEFSYGIVGADAIDKVGDPFPIRHIELCRDSDAVLFLRRRRS